MNQTLFAPFSDACRTHRVRAVRFALTYGYWQAEGQAEIQALEE